MEGTALQKLSRKPRVEKFGGSFDLFNSMGCIAETAT
jgi:hypothetical protein